MSEREKHLFQFRASEIAAAAHDEAVYHQQREQYWRGVLNEATSIVEATARIKVTRQEQTGGWTPVVTVDYGDAAEYKRMQMAAQKIQRHHADYERFESDERLYATQFDASAGRERTYELDADDVAHFRLNGLARET